MKKIKMKKTIVFVLIGAAVLQAGVIGYSMVEKQLFSSIAESTGASQDTEGSGSTSEASQTAQTSQTVDTAIIADNNDSTNTDISQEIQDLIKQSDPDNFERNLSNYKDLLTSFDVHLSLKNEIESLIKDGHNVKDILTTYAFLYDSYGLKDELKKLVNEKESGREWADIFTEYNTENPEFEPRSFESSYLDKLMGISGISNDDIMIADRVSCKTNVSIDEIIELKAKTSKWKVVNASLGIINSQQHLPYVPITAQMVNKYLSGDMTEDTVVDALIIANKLNTSSSDIVEMIKAGLSIEQVYAKVYESKYY